MVRKKRKPSPEKAAEAQPKKEMKEAAPKPAPKPAPSKPSGEARGPAPEEAVREAPRKTAKEAATEAKPPAKGSAFKTIAVAVLLVIALALAYYFLNQSSAAFVPGPTVDQGTFLTNFDSASNIFIVMDVRGVKDSTVSNNILQCGVDFAGSSGMGGKTVTPISISNDGCVAPDGKRDPSDCFSMLKNGITIYVKQGSGGASYYSNGMILDLGANYTTGQCAITRQ